MTKRLVLVAGVLFALSTMAWAADNSWTGTVSDSHCAAKHSTASAAAAECVEKCVAGGAKYVLVSGGKVYQVEPQEKFKGMGGTSVKVTGTIEGGTITAESVEPQAKLLASETMGRAISATKFR